MTSPRKPHLLHVTINKWHDVDYRIECPYDPADRSTDCTPWVECGHYPPREPDMPQPKHVWVRDEGRAYVDNADPAAVEAWMAYWSAVDAHGESHPYGPYEKKDGCWVSSYLDDANAPGDTWGFAPSLTGQPIVSPMKVDFYNDGGEIEDSSPMLTLWEEPRGE